MGLFDFFKFGKKKPEVEEKDDLTGITRPGDLKDPNQIFDWDKIEEPIIYGNKQSKKSFLIVDDLEDAFHLYDTDIKRVKRHYDIDILKRFKIVKCVGNDAGFIAQKYLRETEDNLVIALLDITFGKIYKGNDGTIVTCDGIDIALEIIDKYPKCDFRFCTAHRLGRKNTEILKFIEKFESNTNLNIEDYYFSKNDKRHEYIYDMVKKIVK